jgi:hypothetical protein
MTYYFTPRYGSSSSIVVDPPTTDSGGGGAGYGGDRRRTYGGRERSYVETRIPKAGSKYYAEVVQGKKEEIRTAVKAVKKKVEALPVLQLPEVNKQEIFLAVESIYALLRQRQSEKDAQLLALRMAWEEAQAEKFRSYLDNLNDLLEAQHLTDIQGQLVELEATIKKAERRRRIEDLVLMYTISLD